MTKLTAADIANNVTVERALNEVRTKDELDAAIDQIIDLSAPSEAATVDLADLAEDSIAVLGDGSVLAWGAEERINGRSYRRIMVYGGTEDGRGVMSAQLQADIWEDSQVSED